MFIFFFNLTVIARGGRFSISRNNQTRGDQAGPILQLVVYVSELVTGRYSLMQVCRSRVDLTNVLSVQMQPLEKGKLAYKLLSMTPRSNRVIFTVSKNRAPDATSKDQLERSTRCCNSSGTSSSQRRSSISSIVVLYEVSPI